MIKNYGHEFYKDRHQKTIYSATTILSKVLEAVPVVNSAIDFGCGVGTWLSVLKGKGVNEIQGIDGAWVNKSLLEIPEHCFLQADLGEPVRLDRKYDLAISLEVAEHLPPEAANAFVNNLTNASDFVLFSAAIPFQGGKNHINEQWPDYWVGLFNGQGFSVLDFIRGEVWNDNNVPVWYRQNVFLFVNNNRMQDIKGPTANVHGASRYLPTALVHPDHYLSKVSQIDTVKGSWKLFRRAIKAWGKQKLLGRAS